MQDVIDSSNSLEPWKEIMKIITLLLRPILVPMVWCNFCRKCYDHDYKGYLGFGITGILALLGIIGSLLLAFPWNLVLSVIFGWLYVRNLKLARKFAVRSENRYSPDTLAWLPRWAKSLVDKNT